MWCIMLTSDGWQRRYNPNGPFSTNSLYYSTFRFICQALSLLTCGDDCDTLLSSRNKNNKQSSICNMAKYQNGREAQDGDHIVVGHLAGTLSLQHEDTAVLLYVHNEQVKSTHINLDDAIPVEDFVYTVENQKPVPTEKDVPPVETPPSGKPPTKAQLKAAAKLETPTPEETPQ